MKFDVFLRFLELILKEFMNWIEGSKLMENMNEKERLKIEGKNEFSFSIYKSWRAQD